jgi:hypothetical protein
MSRLYLSVPAEHSNNHIRSLVSLSQALYRCGSNIALLSRHFPYFLATFHYLETIIFLHCH